MNEGPHGHRQYGGDGHWYADGPAGYDDPGSRNSGIGAGYIVAIALLVTVILVVSGLLVARVVLSDSGTRHAAENVHAEGGADDGSGAETQHGGADDVGQETASDPAPTVTVTSSPETESTPEPTTDAEARARLDDYIRDGEAAWHRVENRWVPQLSSKRDGLVADGRTWDHVAILEEFEGFRARYPDATLLRSSDFGVFQPGWYVTILTTPSETSDYESILRWCRGEGFGADHCLAKLLQRHGTPGGSTRTN